MRKKENAQADMEKKTEEQKRAGWSKYLREERAHIKDCNETGEASKIPTNQCLFHLNENILAISSPIWLKIFSQYDNIESCQNIQSI